MALSNGSTYTNISSLIPDTTLRNYGAAIGSFDGNNKTQIYLQNYDSINSRNNTAVLTYTNNAFQTTSPLPLWSGVNIKSESYVAAADFNGDGFDDVLISCGWTDRANIIVYGSKKGLDPNTLNQLPSGPYGQDNYDFNKSWPPKIILSDAEYNALSFDFNGDGKPDIFSVSHQEIYYPEGTFQDTSNTNYNSFGVGQGGSYYGNSAYNTLTNIDGKNFKSTVPISSDLGSKYYVQIMKYDINQDGFMDVIGLYYTKMFRDSRTNMLMGSMTGTTLFLNDGKGNFKVVDIGYVGGSIAMPAQSEILNEIGIQVIH